VPVNDLPANEIAYYIIKDFTLSNVRVHPLEISSCLCLRSVQNTQLSLNSLRMVHRRYNNLKLSLISILRFSGIVRNNTRSKSPTTCNSVTEFLLFHLRQ
jgi:hypothetical protein